MIRVGLIALLVVMCVRIIAPFVNLVVWALILAIVLHPLHNRLARSLGGRQGLAAAALVVLGLLLLGVPTAMLGSSFAGHLHDAYIAVKNHTLMIPPPNPHVAEWPIVGERLFDTWSSMAANLPAYLEENRALIRNLTQQVLSAAANTAGAVMLFLGSMVVAGIMMAYAESGDRAMQRLFNRLTDPVRGPRLKKLATATVRSVAGGVIGVAFVQAILLGLGFMLAGIPAAGVLALIVMFIGILQLPVVLVSLPSVVYLWWSGDGSMTSNIIYTVYLLLAGMADNVLKPLMLGRGVNAPMLVILIGAVGGMVSAGIIGLFVGSVLLAVSYQLFMEWVGSSEASPGAEPGLAEAARKDEPR
ncbi:MAG: AI-2E family transporter [Nitrococcus sp.]|nr:AI-2E family transporter [Nitrococcus sp.]